jgi:hypothetical protein
MRHLSIAAALFSALFSPLAGPALGQAQVSVPGNQIIVLPGTDLTISLTQVQDQRCRADVQCVWEGLVRVELLLTGPRGCKETIVLCNRCEDGGRSASGMGHDFAYVGLSPGRDTIDKLGRDSTLTDYSFVLALD